MGACASKPKVKDDAAPAPISVSKELLPDDDSPVEKALIVDNGPPPPASDAKILLEKKSNESESPKSESLNQEATMNEKPQTEGDLNLDPIRTQSQPESADNLGEECDQIKVPMQSELKLPDVNKPVEAIKEQEPTKQVTKDSEANIPSSNGVSDKMVVENEHKLSNGINTGSKEEEEGEETEKAMRKAVADTKIENNGKSTVEKDSIQGGAEKGVMV